MANLFNEKIRTLADYAASRGATPNRVRAGSLTILVAGLTGCGTIPLTRIPFEGEDLNGKLTTVQDTGACQQKGKIGPNNIFGCKIEYNADGSIRRVQVGDGVVSVQSEGGAVVGAGLGLLNAAANAALGAGVLKGALDGNGSSGAAAGASAAAGAGTTVFEKVQTDIGTVKGGSGVYVTPVVQPSGLGFGS